MTTMADTMPESMAERVRRVAVELGEPVGETWSRCIRNRLFPRDREHGTDWEARLRVYLETGVKP